MDPPPPPPRELPLRPRRPPVLLTPQVWEVISGALAGDISGEIADPSVRVPAVGAAVRYHPRLHASSPAQLPEYIDCSVHGVLLFADPVTLELLAEVTLSRHPPQHPLPAPAPAYPIRFFTKAVSQSDVANRITIGRDGDKLFGAFRPAKSLPMTDIFGFLYVLKRNKHRTIAKGWREFTEGKAIRTGDRVVFMRRAEGCLIGLRRASTPEEREMARARVQDVLHLVDRLQGGELVTVTFYPGRSQTFLVEAEVHTPPPALVHSQEDEDPDPSVIVVSTGSETEDVIVSSGSVTDDDPSDYSVVSLDCKILDPDYPASRVIHLTGIPRPRGVRVKRVVIQYTPDRGRRSSRRGN